MIESMRTKEVKIIEGTRDMRGVQATWMLLYVNGAILFALLGKYIAQDTASFIMDYIIVGICGWYALLYGIALWSHWNFLKVVKTKRYEV
jgi:uncharacterized membrane protein YuzA (DUF378 family)